MAISRDPQAPISGERLGRVAIRPGDWTRLASRARNTIKVASLADDLSSSGMARPDQVRIHHVEHHRAHLASAFFASPFDEAAVVSIDGFGDFSSVMWGVGRGNQIRRPRRRPLPALARACSTPPSPSSSASRSTATNTR